nr:PREDICTED: prominin-2 isoform X1 [Latimeria chalumnae]|eukprot:XP_014348721.1 PREDICTED: prominin-2 isoform X1 [Latimeria chalumnae]
MLFFLHWLRFLLQSWNRLCLHCQPADDGLRGPQSEISRLRSGGLQVLFLQHSRGIGQRIGLKIKASLAERVNSVLGKADTLAKDMNLVQNNLETINGTTIDLQERQNKIESRLSNIRADINRTLSSDNCTSCNGKLSEIQKLEQNTNYQRIPLVSTELNKVKKAMETNLTSSIQEGNNSFNAIPENVTAQTRDVITEIKMDLDKIEEEVLKNKDTFPFIDATTTVMNEIQSAQKLVKKYGDKVKEYDRYRWIVGIVLCAIILLIIACNLLGLLFGVVGVSLRDDPHEKNCSAGSGANFLMAGVGFSFLFSSLLILLVFVTFLVGGNTRTLVCKPWENQELFQFIDTPGNLPQWNLSSLFQFKNVSLKLVDIYNDCNKGKNLWTAFHLSQEFDLTDYLDHKKYTQNFESQFDRFDVDLSTTTLLVDSSIRSIKDFEESGFNSINYDEFLLQINKPLINISLLDFAQQLEILRETQTNPMIRTQLTNESRALRDLQNSLVSAQEADVRKLNASIQYMVSTSPTVLTRLNRTLMDITTVQTQLLTKAKEILKTEANCHREKFIGYLQQFLDWVMIMITNELLPCQPITIYIDNARVILCDHIINPWNAFWYCLAWATLFLIPSIIFAVKTAKYFRPIHRSKSSSAKHLDTAAPIKFPRATAPMYQENAYESI